MKSPLANKRLEAIVCLFLQRILDGERLVSLSLLQVLLHALHDHGTRRNHASAYTLADGIEHDILAGCTDDMHEIRLRQCRIVLHYHHLLFTRLHIHLVERSRATGRLSHDVSRRQALRLRLLAECLLHLAHRHAGCTGQGDNTRHHIGTNQTIRVEDETLVGCRSHAVERRSAT